MLSDATVLTADATLSAFVPLVNAQDGEIRRQAVCSLASFAQRAHCAAVASLPVRCGPAAEQCCLLRCLLRYLMGAACDERSAGRNNLRRNQTRISRQRMHSALWLVEKQE